MRNIVVAAVLLDLTAMDDGNVNLVNIGFCKIKDNCTPNPCEHDRICTQDWEDFHCECEATSYIDQVCHICKFY